MENKFLKFHAEKKLQNIRNFYFNLSFFFFHKKNKIIFLDQHQQILLKSANALALYFLIY